LAQAPGLSEPILEVVAELVRAWSDSQLRQIPALARDAAAELLEHDTPQAARIIRSVGLGRLDAGLQDLLAAFLAQWDKRLQSSSGERALAYAAGLRAEGTDAWRKWVETCPPDELGVRMARMLESCLIDGTTLPNADDLRRVMGGHQDVRERRAGEAVSAQRKLLRGDELARFRNVILSAFDRNELEQLLRFHLDVRLYDEIASPGRSFGQTVVEVLMWAEQQGITAELIKALAQERPARPDVQQLLADFVGSAN
jgi:hypothetical protein